MRSSRVDVVINSSGYLRSDEMFWYGDFVVPESNSSRLAAANQIAHPGDVHRCGLAARNLRSHFALDLRPASAGYLIGIAFAIVDPIDPLWGWSRPVDRSEIYGFLNLREPAARDLRTTATI
jgi:hypothetical protein